MKRILLLVTIVFFFGNSYASDIPIKLRRIIDLYYKGNNYVTVFDSTRVEMMDSGLSYVNHHLLHKILTVDGALKL